MSHCTECRAFIRWMKGPGDKNIPLDTLPSLDGKFVVLQSGKHVRAVPVGADLVEHDDDEPDPNSPEDLGHVRPSFPGRPRYTSHLDTCIAAKRRKRKRLHE
jgi:hypothetical protein